MAQLQQLYDFVGGFRLETAVANVRHLAWQVEQRLLGIIELRRQRAILGVIDSQALANVIEPPSDSQCRGSQDDRVEFFEQPLAQDLADVDGRGGQKNALVSPLVPINEIAFVRFEQEGQLLAKLEASPRDARQLLRLRRKRRKFRLHAFQRRHQRIVRFAVLLQERFPLAPQKRESPVPRRKQLEKASAAFPDSLRLAQQRWRAQMQ